MKHYVINKVSDYIIRF